MKSSEATLLTLRAEVEEAIELIDRAEKVLHKVPDKNMQLAAKFLSESNRSVTKHKRNKLDFRRSVYFDSREEEKRLESSNSR